MFGHFFGNYLVKNGVITEEQLQEVLEIQKTSRVKMGLIAVSEKMLTARQTYEINMLQVTLDKRFGDIAVEKGCRKVPKGTKKLFPTRLLVYKEISIYYLFRL